MHCVCICAGMHVCVCMCVCVCLVVCLCACMHVCVCMHACVLLCVCVYACMCVLCVCMYVCVYTCYTLSKLSSNVQMQKKIKQSPTLSLGSKHPYPNICHEIFFTPHQPNLSPNTCQYLSSSMHALVYTFKAFVKSADVKKKNQSPILSLGSKYPYLNICCEIFFTPNWCHLSPDTCHYLS